MKTYKKLHRKRTTKNKKQKIKRTKNKIKRTNYKKNRILGGSQGRVDVDDRDLCSQMLDITEDGIQGKVALHFILGPVMDEDIKQFEALRKTHDKVIVILQGGLDQNKNNPYSTTLMGILPANAGMNPGKPFSDKEGWYDQLSPPNVKKYKEKNIFFILQLTNSAKPSGATSPIYRAWIDFVDHPQFPKGAMQNYLYSYKAISGAPWMHDPIEVLACIDKLKPSRFFSKLKQPLPWNRGYKFDTTGGNFGTLGEEFNIIVCPWEHNDTQLAEYHERSLVPTMVSALNGQYFEGFETDEKGTEYLKVKEISQDPDAKLSITLSIEIYDPDNLFACKLLETFCSKLGIKLEVIVHSAYIDLDVPFTMNLMELRDNISTESQDWILKQYAIKDKFDGPLYIVRKDTPPEKVIDEHIINKIKYYNQHPKPVGLLPPFSDPEFPLAIAIAGYFICSNGRELKAETKRSAFVDHEMILMKRLFPTSLIRPGNLFNQLGNGDYKFTEATFNFIVSLMDWDTLSNKTHTLASIKTILESIAGDSKSTIRGKRRQKILESWLSIKNNSSVNERTNRPNSVVNEHTNGRNGRNGVVTTKIKVYSLNVLDPAVANKTTLNLNDVKPKLPDEDAPVFDDDKLFNAERFKALSIKIREKLDQDYVVLLQEVSDDFVKVLFPDMDLSDAPPKSPPSLKDNPTLEQIINGYSAISDEKDGYQFTYYRSYKMAANAQQGLLIACKNKIVDNATLINGNKACSIVIDNIRYGTAHFPAGYRGNVPFDYTCQLKNVLPYDDYPCIFAADMNNPPEKFVELGAMNGFEYVNTGAEMTTCGVKFFTGIKDGLPTYGYAAPNKIDGIWVASKKPSLNEKERPKVKATATVETLNTTEQYYSDHKGIDALILLETL